MLRFDLALDFFFYTRFFEGLVSFQTVVFYEPEYSLYTLWQALHRVWHLGQTQPVKAVFAVYKDAMEAQALALMGRKMRAAQTLYGDEVGCAIVPAEEGDFITELAREVLRGAELDDLQSLFADGMRVSNSPMGCPTEVSPVLIPVNTKPGWIGRWNTRQLKSLLVEDRLVNETISFCQANCQFGKLDWRKEEQKTNKLKIVQWLPERDTSSLREAR